MADLGVGCSLQQHQGPTTTWTNVLTSIIHFTDFDTCGPEWAEAVRCPFSVCLVLKLIVYVYVYVYVYVSPPRLIHTSLPSISILDACP